MLEPHLELVHHILVPAFDGVVHLCVANRQRALFSERRHELLLIIGEGVGVVGVDRKHSDHLFTTHQRYEQHRGDLLSLHLIVMSNSGIRMSVENRHTRSVQGFGHRFARVGRRSLQVLLTKTKGRSQLEVPAPVEKPDRTAPDAQTFAHHTHSRLEDLLQIERRPRGRGDLAENVVEHRVGDRAG